MRAESCRDNLPLSAALSCKGAAGSKVVSIVASSGAVEPTLSHRKVLGSLLHKLQGTPTPTSDVQKHESASSHDAALLLPLGLILEQLSVGIFLNDLTAKYIAFQPGSCGRANLGP